MDTIYNSNKLRAGGFVVFDGTNTFGVMGAGASGIEFQAASGTGYVNITADDVKVPVMNGGNTGYVTMKEINSLLEDTKTEKDVLRDDFDVLKQTFDSIVNIDKESGRNLYADNIVTQSATVDGKLAIDTLQIKGTEFQPVDVDGNRVPIRVQNVFIGNNDVQNDIQNLKAWRTQTDQLLTEGENAIGVGTVIRHDNGGLVIEAKDITVDTLSTKMLQTLDMEDNIKGYIA